MKTNSNKNLANMRNISKYDAYKTKAVFLYVLEKLGRADKLCSLKIIYYANKEHLIKYGKPIICDDFIAMPRGPVPSFLLDAINRTTGRQYRERPYVDILMDAITSTNKGYRLQGIEKPDLDELSKSDIMCLDNSIAANKGLNPDELSDKSHKDKAWQDAHDNNGIMDDIQMARDSGASNEMIKLITDHLEFTRFCKQ